MITYLMEGLLSALRWSTTSRRCLLLLEHWWEPYVGDLSSF